MPDSHIEIPFLFYDLGNQLNNFIMTYRPNMFAASIHFIVVLYLSNPCNSCVYFPFYSVRFMPVSKSTLRTCCYLSSLFCASIAHWLTAFKHEIQLTIDCLLKLCPLVVCLFFVFFCQYFSFGLRQDIDLHTEFTGLYVI